MFVLVGLATGVMLWLTGAEMALGVTAYLVLGIVIVITAIDMFKDLMRGHWGARHSCGHRHDRDTRRTGICRGAHHRVDAHRRGSTRRPRRASRELDQLLSRAPAFASRIHPVTGEVERIAIEEVKVGDELLVRSSEILPVDGVLLSNHATIDESSVTGEPIPVNYHAGDPLLSGTVNSTTSFTMRAPRCSSPPRSRSWAG